MTGKKDHKKEYEKKNISKYLNIDINDINDDNIDTFRKELKNKKIIDKEKQLKEEEIIMIEQLKNNNELNENEIKNLSETQKNIKKKEFEIIKKVYNNIDNEKIDKRIKKKEDKKISDYTLDKLKEYQKKPIYNERIGKIVKNYHTNKRINDYYKLIDELIEKGIVVDNKIDINNLELITKLALFKI